MSGEPKTVWIIEHGSYSDYRVVGIYSSHQKAQRVADYLNSGDSAWSTATVRERPLDPAVDAINAGYMCYVVNMLRDGTVERVVASPIDAYDIEEHSRVRVWERSKAPAYRDKNVPDCLSGHVLAKNEEHAIKIVNERRTQMIANGEWK